MTQLEVLFLVTDTLNRLGIDYMLTGAYAVSFYGRPRTTHDIDFVVIISEEDAEKIYYGFKDSFYVDKESIKEAIREKSMFNIINNETMNKVDFWIFKNDAFDQKRLERKRKESIEGKSVFISSPEDMILIKLLWYKKTDIQKHYNDALGIFEVQTGNLDMNYIKEWAKHFSFLDIVEEMIKKCN